MSKLSIAFLAVATLVAWPVASAKELAPRPLLVDGKPINPLCLLPIADQTGQSSRIDLKNCVSDITLENTIPPIPGLIGFDYANKGEPSDWPRSSFYYRYLGQLGKVSILFAQYSGGGSGHFTSLVELERRDAASFNFRDIAGGDRCNGAISNYSVTNGHVQYTQDLTPWMLMQFGLAQLDTAFDGLESSATSCVATAHMRGSHLVSITLDHGVANNSYKPQACFDQTHLKFVGKKDFELDRAKLDSFRSQFKACIAGR